MLRPRACSWASGPISSNLLPTFPYCFKALAVPVKPQTAINHKHLPNFPHRFFTHTPRLPAKPLPPRLKINDADLTISYLKGTGPGGQKINKTNSAVQISHGPSGIVVKCQATRSRSQNEKIARSLLADRIEHQEKGIDSRVSLKAEAARKKKASKLKKAKRKYRSLEDESTECDMELEHQDTQAQDREVESDLPTKEQTS
ncbi:peptide chain release factor-like protein [Penicillium chermesinum]|uniref:Peptide chain release factor-like protein n=1 Tax=Penicillium chermesinum TaxID=63820 RepID=A0A9W9PM39_9EURO|nr:peptide chain release factor-like protein [Penicillium chermesinum]KAJ5248905.1 peptide chain release factor-like protein [Penicillium chermesinum]KAJ6151007.1 peptide chain release factor-like protein [Penicillium chermesinum]